MNAPQSHTERSDTCPSSRAKAARPEKAFNETRSPQEARARVLVAGLLLLFIGCGDDTTAMDGGIDASLDSASDALVDANVTLREVAPATRPTPPTFACPPNWRLLRHDYGRLCDAHEGFIVETCPGVGGRHVGSEACHVVGPQCEAPFGTVEGNTWFVAPSDAGVGTGTESDPFRTLATAVDAASAGDTILLEQGTYELAEGQRIDDLHIRGRCVEGVRLRVPADGRGLRLFGESSVANVAIEGGILSIGVADDANVRIDSVVLLDVQGIGILIADGAEAEMAHLTLRAGEPNFDVHVGLRIRGRATASFLRIVGFADEQIDVESEGAHLELTDASLSGDNELLVILGGHGIEVERGASLQFERVQIEGLTEAGLIAKDEGTTVTGNHITILECLGESSVDVIALGGANVHLTQSGLFYAARVVTASGENSSVLIEDSYIGGGYTETQLRGYGAFAAENARLTLRRVESAGSLFQEVRAERNAQVTLEDVRLHRTFNDDDEATGVAALRLQSGARVSIDRVEIEDSGPTAVIASNAHLEGQHLAIHETLFDPLSGYAAALYARNGATVDLTHLDINSVPYVGALIESQARVTLRETRIDNVSPSRCLDRRCRSFLGGIGLSVSGGAQVELEGFRIERAALVGAQISHGENDDGEQLPGGELDLHDGSIIRSEIGINLQVQDYDTDRLFDRVVLERNTRNFDSTIQPVVFPEL